MSISSSSYNKSEFKITLPGKTFPVKQWDLTEIQEKKGLYVRNLFSSVDPSKIYIYQNIGENETFDARKNSDNPHRYYHPGFYYDDPINKIKNGNIERNNESLSSDSSSPALDNFMYPLKESIGSLYDISDDYKFGSRGLICRANQRANNIPKEILTTEPIEINNSHVYRLSFWIKTQGPQTIDFWGQNSEDELPYSQHVLNFLERYEINSHDWERYTFIINPLSFFKFKFNGFVKFKFLTKGSSGSFLLLDGLQLINLTENEKQSIYFEEDYSSIIENLSLNAIEESPLEIDMEQNVYGDNLLKKMEHPLKNDIDFICESESVKIKYANKIIKTDFIKIDPSLKYQIKFQVSFSEPDGIYEMESYVVDNNKNRVDLFDASIELGYVDNGEIISGCKVEFFEYSSDFFISGEIDSFFENFPGDITISEQQEIGWSVFLKTKSMSNPTDDFIEIKKIIIQEKSA